MDGKMEGNVRSPPPGVVIPPSWEEAAGTIAYDSSSFPPPITLICGPANSGKSTFSRHLLNTLLKRYKRVGYLDTDVGQPEFITPGCVSLHIIVKKTPDLTVLCLKKPERCIFFGHVSANHEAKAYYNSIISLYDYFCQEFYQIKEMDNPYKTLLPLIINTSGWVKGSGYGMLVELQQHSSPSHIVKVCDTSESKNLPDGLFWLEKSKNKSVNLVQICAVNESSNGLSCRNIMRKEALMMRDIRIIAYFRQCLPREMNFSDNKEFTDTLASIPSYEIPLSKVKVRHSNCQVISCVSSQGLNASIVGLAVSSSELSDNNTPWCIGLGIVRGVDSLKDKLYLLTPIPSATLKNVDLILQGTIDIPACLQKESLSLTQAGIDRFSLGRRFMGLNEKGFGSYFVGIIWAYYKSCTFNVCLYSFTFERLIYV